FRRFLDFELPEPRKRNLLAVRSGAHDGLQHAVDDRLGLRLAHAVRLGNFRDEFGRVHFGLPRESRGPALLHGARVLSSRGRVRLRSYAKELRIYATEARVELESTGRKGERFWRRRSIGQSRRSSNGSASSSRVKSEAAICWR